MIDSDFKLGLAALLVLVGLLCATVVACVAIDAHRDSQFIKAGYTYRMLPGEPRPQWVKEDK